MNANNKAQFTYARINFVPKDSSCYTPSPKILKLAVLTSNAISISTKAFKFPYTNDDSVLARNGTIHSNS